MNLDSATSSNSLQIIIKKLFSLAKNCILPTNNTEISELIDKMDSKQRQQLFYTKNEQGETLGHIYVLQGYFEGLLSLIEKGFDATTMDTQNLDCIDYLLFMDKGILVFDQLRQSQKRLTDKDQLYDAICEHEKERMPALEKIHRLLSSQNLTYANISAGLMLAIQRKNMELIILLLDAHDKIEVSEDMFILINDFSFTENAIYLTLLRKEWQLAIDLLCVFYEPTQDKSICNINDFIELFEVFETSLPSDEYTTTIKPFLFSKYCVKYRNLISAVDEIAELQLWPSSSLALVKNPNNAPDNKLTTLKQIAEVILNPGDYTQEVLHFILNAQTANLQEIDYKGWTIIHYLACAGLRKTMNLVLDKLQSSLKPETFLNFLNQEVVAANSKELILVSALALASYEHIELALDLIKRGGRFAEDTIGQEHKKRFIYFFFINRNIFLFKKMISVFEKNKDYLQHYDFPSNLVQALYKQAFVYNEHSVILFLLKHKYQIPTDTTAMEWLNLFHNIDENDIQHVKAIFKLFIETIDSQKKSWQIYYQYICSGEITIEDLMSKLIATQREQEANAVLLSLFNKADLLERAARIDSIIPNNEVSDPLNHALILFKTTAAKILFKNKVYCSADSINQRLFTAIQKDSSEEFAALLNDKNLTAEIKFKGLKLAVILNSLNISKLYVQKLIPKQQNLLQASEKDIRGTISILLSAILSGNFLTAQQIFIGVQGIQPLAVKCVDYLKQSQLIGEEEKNFKRFLQSEYAREFRKAIFAEDIILAYRLWPPHYNLMPVVLDHPNPKSSVTFLYYVSQLANAVYSKKELKKLSSAHYQALAEKIAQLNIEKLIANDPKTKCSILHYLAAAGFNDALKAALNCLTRHNLLDKMSADGNTPLCYALRNQHFSTCFLLLEYGAPFVVYSNKENFISKIFATRDPEYINKLIEILIHRNLVEPSLIEKLLAINLHQICAKLIEDFPKIILIESRLTISKRQTVLNETLIKNIFQSNNAAIAILILNFCANHAQYFTKFLLLLADYKSLVNQLHARLVELTDQQWTDILIKIGIHNPERRKLNRLLLDCLQAGNLLATRHYLHKLCQVENGQIQQELVTQFKEGKMDTVTAMATPSKTHKKKKKKKPAQATEKNIDSASQTIQSAENFFTAAEVRAAIIENNINVVVKAWKQQKLKDYFKEEDHWHGLIKLIFDSNQDDLIQAFVQFGWQKIVDPKKEYFKEIIPYFDKFIDIANKYKTIDLNGRTNSMWLLLQSANKDFCTIDRFKKIINEEQKLFKLKNANKKTLAECAQTVGLFELAEYFQSQQPAKTDNSKEKNSEELTSSSTVATHSTTVLTTLFFPPVTLKKQVTPKSPVCAAIQVMISAQIETFTSILNRHNEVNCENFYIVRLEAILLQLDLINQLLPEHSQQFLVAITACQNRIDSLRKKIIFPTMDLSIYTAKIEQYFVAYFHAVLAFFDYTIARNYGAAGHSLRMMKVHLGNFIKSIHGLDDIETELDAFQQLSIECGKKAYAKHSHSI